MHSSGVLVIATLFGLAAADPIPAQCSSPVPQTCDYYTKCVEPAVNCGPKGYPLGYGLKYCQAFTAKKDKFTPAGQEWLFNVMECLQKDLVPVAQGSEVFTCPKLKAFAIAGHAKCYTERGHSICSLPPKDWFKIIGIIKAVVLEPGTIKTMLQIARSCGGNIFRQVSDNLEQPEQSLIESF